MEYNFWFIKKTKRFVEIYQHATDYKLVDDGKYIYQDKLVDRISSQTDLRLMRIQT